LINNLYIIISLPAKKMPAWNELFNKMC